MLPQLALVALWLATASAAPWLAVRDLGAVPGTVYTGQATYYNLTQPDGQGGLSACGQTYYDTDHVVALNEAQYDPDNTGGPSGNCFDYVQITNTANGNQITAQIVDLCPGCKDGSLDMSVSVFSALSDGDLAEGVFPISWELVSGSSSATTASATPASTSASPSSSSTATASSSASGAGGHAQEDFAGGTSSSIEPSAPSTPAVSSTSTPAAPSTSTASSTPTSAAPEASTDPSASADLGTATAPATLQTGGTTMSGSDDGEYASSSPTADTPAPSTSASATATPAAPAGGNGGGSGGTCAR